MADKILKNEDFQVIRFSCDCLSHRHLMEVAVELADDGRRFVDCAISMYVAGGSPFKFRLQQIWNMLRGKNGELLDFIVRPEDIGELADFFNKYREG